MPRPNQARTVLAEDNVAERVRVEREGREWSYEGMAKRVTDAGCPINASALHRIETARPRRKISVDELVAFARVFRMTPAEMLVPPDVAISREAAAAFEAWARAREHLDDAVTAVRETLDRLKHAVKDSPVARDAIRPLVDEVAAGSLIASSALMHAFTDDEAELPPEQRKLLAENARMKAAADAADKDKLAAFFGEEDA